MTAIGFLIYIIGRIGAEVTENEIVVPMQVLGVTFMVIGITEWLWMHMP